MAVPSFLPILSHSEKVGKRFIWNNLYGNDFCIMSIPIHQVMHRNVYWFIHKIIKYGRNEKQNYSKTAARGTFLVAQSPFKSSCHLYKINTLRCYYPRWNHFIYVQWDNYCCFPRPPSIFSNEVVTLQLQFLLFWINWLLRMIFYG